jgi:hypothetical protein
MINYHFKMILKNFLKTFNNKLSKTEILLKIRITIRI